MKRAFRLATVERLRSTQLDEAAAALAAARQGVAAAIARQDELADELGRCVPATTSGVSGFEAAGARRGVLRERLDAAAGDVRAAREHAAAALLAWTTARAQLRAVETLHERHRDAVRVEDFRREQRELDDLAGSRRRLLGEAVA